MGYPGCIQRGVQQHILHYRNQFQDVVEEGFEAVQGAIALKELLLEVKDRVSANPDDFDQLIASVDYEIELFRLLD